MAVGSPQVAIRSVANANGRGSIAPATDQCLSRDRRPAAVSVGTVNQDAEVLDILVQPRRDKRAAERLLRKLLKVLKSKIQKRRPGRTGPLRLACVVASHIHIAHATHPTHATAALVVLGQFGNHPGGREHQSRD
jgi:hypothetical protein